MPAHQYPHGHVFYRTLTRPLPRIARGEGVWLVGDDGRRYLDAAGGAYVATIGHGVREIGDAMAAQAQTLGYVSGLRFTHEPVERFAAALAALAPGDLDYVYPLGSGSEAIEAALKLARQYWVESARPRKHKVLALTPAYHGNTLLALSASAREHYRSLYQNWLVAVPRVPAPYAYRCACGGRAPYCDACSGAALEQAIAAEDPETVAAFILEPVGGSSTGANLPPPGYLARVREICSRHDVLLIADEVLCGAGRTGRWSAVDHAGVVPDIIVYGKGISGGYAPLSAVVAPRRLLDVIAAGSGALVHAQTYSHHAVMCAGGVATLRYLHEHKLVEGVASRSAQLFTALEPLRTHALVGDVRGIGLLAAIELVADRATRAPFPRSAKLAERAAQSALDLGLVVWTNVGHLPGGDGDIVLVAPPFTISDAECREIGARLRGTLDAIS